MKNFLKILGFCDGLEMGDNTKAAAIRYFLLCGRIQIRNYNSYPDPTLSFGSYCIFDGPIALYSEHGVVVKNYVKFQAG